MLVDRQAGRPMFRRNRTVLFFHQHHKGNERVEWCGREPNQVIEQGIWDGGDELVGAQGLLLVSLTGQAAGGLWP